MKVNENLRVIRKKHGVTQKEMASVLGLDESSYCKIENGIARINVDYLEKIASYLEEDITYFFTYPKRYVDKESLPLPERVTVTFEVNVDDEQSLIDVMQGKCKYVRKNKR